MEGQLTHPAQGIGGEVCVENGLWRDAGRERTGRARGLAEIKSPRCAGRVRRRRRLVRRLRVLGALALHNPVQPCKRVVGEAGGHGL